jgi:hypothetical protein
MIGGEFDSRVVLRGTWYPGTHRPAGKDNGSAGHFHHPNLAEPLTFSLLYLLAV